MMRLATLLALLGLTCVPLGAQTTGRPPEGTPLAAAQASVTLTAEQVLERYVSALGGREALQKVSGRVSKGTFTMPEGLLCMNVEIVQKAPHKWLRTLTSPCLGTIPFHREGFDGAVIWDDSILGAGPSVESAPEKVAAEKQARDFYADVKLRELYPGIAFKGTENKGGREVHVLEATDARDNPVRWYFDAQTGLLSARTSLFWDGDTDAMAEEDYTDYKAVDGIQIPHTVHRWHYENQLRWILRLNEVRHDIAIDDARFGPPAHHEAFQPKLKPLIGGPPRESRPPTAPPPLPREEFDFPDSPETKPAAAAPKKSQRVTARKRRRRPGSGKRQ